MYGYGDVEFRTVRRALVVVLMVLGCAGPAGAQDPAFTAAETANFAAATGRAQAWLTDPAFLAAPAGVADPARDPAVWSPARGRWRAVGWSNRYGAHIAGELFAPKGDGRFPGVVFIPGAGVGKEAYRWAAEDLAEHGYVVLLFDPQGQGASDVAPDPRFCDADGDWRKPQEMGLTEQGSCAGQDPTEGTASTTTDQVVFLAQARAGHVDPERIGPAYRQLAPRFILGALDATAWLLSGANPWRAQVDATRLGVAGHSLGAYAANMTGNGDPQHRFRAAVALDAFYRDDLNVTPRVPTLMQQSEQESTIGPHLTPVAEPRSPTTLHPTRATYDAFTRSDVDAGFLVPASSNHPDFTDSLQPASLRGQRTAALGLITWMDEYVAGRRGIARLLMSPAPDTADTSSIGTARPLVGGRSHQELLSFLYPTDLHLRGRDCADLRTATCTPPPACTARLHLTTRRGRTRTRVGVSYAEACGRVALISAAARGTTKRAQVLLGPHDTTTLSLRVRRTATIAVRLDGRLVRTLRPPRAAARAR